LEVIGKYTGRGEATVLTVPNLTALEINDCKNVKEVGIEREGGLLLPKLNSLELTSRKRSHHSQL